jgi:hypothetical protein
MVIIGDLAYLMMLPKRLSFNVGNMQSQTLDLTLIQEAIDL